jgi:hypothetical protein
LSVLLSLAQLRRPGRRTRERQTRVDRSQPLFIASHLTTKSPSPTAQEAGFLALDDSWHENTSRDGTNARLQCPQLLRIMRKSSSRPGFHPGVFPALLSQSGSGAVLSKRPGRKDQDLGLISTRIQQGHQVPSPCSCSCWVARQSDRACLASRSAKIRDKTVGRRQQAVQSRVGTSLAFLVSHYQTTMPSLSGRRRLGRWHGPGILGAWVGSPWRCDQPKIGNSAENPGPTP